MRPFRPLLLALFALASATGQDPFVSVSERALRARAGMDSLRVLHFGDSHSGARSYVATWKAYLQAQFGDGGLGYGLPWLSAAGPRCGKTSGWKAMQPTLRNGTDGRSGPGGAYLEARRTGERAWVETRFRRLRLHLLRQPGGGRVRVRVDGREVALADLDGPYEAVCIQPDLNTEARRLEIECLGGAARILGVALENGPGAVYSALGTNGAQAAWLLRSDAEIFATVLRRERPDMVILAFGTNETSLPDFDPDTYRRSLRNLLERFRTAVPGVAFLLLGPPDAVLPRARPGALAEAARIQADLARTFGAQFVSQREAMGGEGSIHAWVADGFALKDRVHFAPDGYARLARAGLTGLLGRMERSLPSTGEDNHLLKARAGAFELPSQAPRLLGRFETGPAEAPPAPRPIYTFRHEDGRLFITDDPAKVEGMKGSWVGRGPQ